MMKIYRLVRGFARQMSRANVNAYAASTAFFIFLSLIPMIMLICSVLAVTPIVQKSDLRRRPFFRRPSPRSLWG